MAWECHAGVADDCVIEDLFDAPYRDPETGENICIPCARELGMHDDETGLPVWHDPDEDAPTR